MPVRKLRQLFFNIYKGFTIGRSGPPKGSLNRATLAIQSLLDGEGEELNPESYLVEHCKPSGSN